MASPSRYGCRPCGTQEIGPVEVEGVDLRGGHELHDLDRLGGFLGKRLELVLGERDVLVLGELVALDHLIAGHDVAVLGADVLLLQLRPALAVQEVEADP
jgi:hypothetical protein